MFLSAMSTWSPADWAAFFTAALPFIAAIGAAVALVINAVNKNTQATIDNTANRAVVADTTNAKLDAIATTVAATTPTVINNNTQPPAAS